MNDPNEDGFVGPTRALFTRLTIDYQNNFRPAKWLTLTSGLFLQPGRCRPGATIRFAGFRATTDLHQRLHRGACGLFGSEREPAARIESRRRRTLRSFQPVRRDLDLSFRRQLQDCADGHDRARERRDRLQSAEQPGQDFRKQSSVWSRKRIWAGTLASSSSLWNDRVRFAATYFHNDLSEPDRLQRALRHAESRRGSHAGAGGGGRAAADRQSLIFARATPISMRKRLRRPTSPSCQAHVCRDGRGTRFIFLALISGVESCAPRRKRNSSTHARN